MSLVTKRQIANVLYPRFSRIVEAVNWNARFQQWLRQFPPDASFSQRFGMFEYVNNRVVQNEPITYLEFGVYNGDSIKQWASLNTHADSRFYGFDSFQGLPEDWYQDFKKGHFDTGGSIPRVDDSRVQFVKGWFQDTLPAFLEQLDNRRRLVIHNDSDLYTSTLFCLVELHRLMRPGTIIIFDEFCVAEHEFRAFIDYTSSYQRRYKSLAGAGAKYIQKLAIEIE